MIRFQSMMRITVLKTCVENIIENKNHCTRSIGFKLFIMIYLILILDFIFYFGKTTIMVPLFHVSWQRRRVFRK